MYLLYMYYIKKGNKKKNYFGICIDCPQNVPIVAVFRFNIHAHNVSITLFKYYMHQYPNAGNVHLHCLQKLGDSCRGDDPEVNGLNHDNLPSSFSSSSFSFWLSLICIPSSSASSCVRSPFPRTTTTGFSSSSSGLSGESSRDKAPFCNKVQDKLYL